MMRFKAVSSSANRGSARAAASAVGAAETPAAKTTQNLVVHVSVLDTGFLKLSGIAFRDRPGFVVAPFYSAMVIALGTAGKLK